MTDTGMKVWMEARKAFNIVPNPYPNAGSEAAAAVITAAMAEDKARMGQLMIAAAAAVKAGMDEYKRGAADGYRRGVSHGLEMAARIARSSQYSKSPAIDTMRGIEKLMQDKPESSSHDQ